MTADAAFSFYHYRVRGWANFTLLPPPKEGVDSAYISFVSAMGETSPPNTSINVASNSIPTTAALEHGNMIH